MIILSILSTENFLFGFVNEYSIDTSQGLKSYVVAHTMRSSKYGMRSSKCYSVQFTIKILF